MKMQSIAMLFKSIAMEMQSIAIRGKHQRREEFFANKIPNTPFLRN